MKVSEYIRRKNAIIEKATGLILVPEDQIIDVEPMELNKDRDSDACPYCQAYSRCGGCPMNCSGNQCDDGDSTYTEVYDALGTKIVFSSVEDEIRELIDEYNKSNGFI